MASRFCFLFVLYVSVLGHEAASRSLQDKYYSSNYKYGYNYGGSTSRTWYAPSNSYSSSGYKSSSYSSTYRSCDEASTVESGSSCKYSWECKSGCCDEFTDKCSDPDKVTFDCQSKTECGASAAEVIIGLIYYCLICCCPCILFFGATAVLTVIFVALSALICGFPLLMVLITIGSGGLATPITGSLLLIWACTLCCLCYCSLKCCRFFMANPQNRIHHAHKRR